MKNSAKKIVFMWSAGYTIIPADFFLFYLLFNYKRHRKMFRDMINIFFLFFAELLEFIAVILSLPARLVADVSTFCYSAARAFDSENNETNEEEQ